LLLAGLRYSLRRGYRVKLRIVLEPSDEGGFTAIVPALPGCVSEGDSREEALRNIEEAIPLYLEPVEDDAGFSSDAEILDIAV
jgi:predicted RNase H-like HicB family nuclease